MRSLVLYLFLAVSPLAAQELRGIWLSRNELGSRAQIAAVMDTIAANNFNTVYVNCWSRGYPLFPSEVFSKHTGLTIDPGYAGRDVLAEAIAEGHRRGLAVEAWFEYGFVGGWTGYYPGTSGKGKIFDAHPDWTAKKSDGSEKDGSNFTWMSHARPDVQEFLLQLHAEVARKYDIDGIEFDRIRYAGNVYGYDAYTDSLWKASHFGAAPPVNGADAEWMRFRADILNSFMRRAYDTVKAVNPNVSVTNAPGFYSSSSYQSYNDNLQDWFQWVETGSVDHVQVQMYVNNDNTLNAYLNYIFSNPVRSVTKKEKVFPALAFSPNGAATATTELMKMVSSTRTRGMQGNAWWYYGDLTPELNAFLRTQVYPAKAGLPGRIPNWRPPGIIVHETDPGVTKSDGWSTLTTVKGFEGTNSLAADSTGNKWVEYTAPVPADGWYEVYAFVPSNPLRSLRTPHDLYDSSGIPRRVYIDQSSNLNKGWNKVGDVYLKQGARKVLRISNDSIGYQRSAAADAVMLTINRKLSPSAVITEVRRENFPGARPDRFWLGQNFPNPFNPSTVIRFALPAAGPAELTVYDLLGREVSVLVRGAFAAGEHAVPFDASALASGLYLYRLRHGAYSEAKKMMLVR